MANLIFTDKDHAGRVYELTLERTTVGRSDQNTLVIADASLSARHCEILVNGPEVIVRDLGSRNGTFVHGVKLQNHQAQLKSGQTVRFGSVEARLELEGHACDDPPSEITAVHAMGRIMREQSREEKHAKPTDPSMKLGSSASTADADRTVTATAEPRATEGTEASTSTSTVMVKAEPQRSSKKAFLFVAAVLMLTLVVFLWFWWGRK